jgi:hypothetical protein
MARRILPLALFPLLAFPTLAAAAGWGSIEAGVTTLEQVRERYGAPSKETRAKVEAYDTVQWTYEGPRAPSGLVRMVVDFGLLTPAGYKPNVVRILRLEPKPHIFPRNAIINGWGVPDGNPVIGGQLIYFYKIGLLVTFDKEGDNAIKLEFSPPQPDTPAPPRR